MKHKPFFAQEVDLSKANTMNTSAVNLKSTTSIKSKGESAYQMPFCSLLPLQANMDSTHASLKARTHLLEARKQSTMGSNLAFEKLS